MLADLRMITRAGDEWCAGAKFAQNRSRKAGEWPYTDARTQKARARTRYADAVRAAPPIDARVGLRTEPVIWEYKTFTARGGMALPDMQLNDFGRQRWELVAFVRTPDDRLIYIFKREKLAPPEPLVVPNPQPPGQGPSP